MLQTKRTYIVVLAFIALFTVPALCQSEGPVGERTLPLHIPFITLDALPTSHANGEAVFPDDLRHTDCSGLDLREWFKPLLLCSFDSRTVWPDKQKMPEYFRPELISVFSANPGCLVRETAKKGFLATGKSIIIIGPPLLTGHEEYRHRLASYTRFGDVSDTASVDGTAWASIIAGKTTGIAFDARMHYLAIPHDEVDGIPVYRSQALQSALRHATSLAVADTGKRSISCIVLPYHIDKDADDADDIESLLEELRSSGIAVITADAQVFGEGTRYLGMGREPLRNPDDYLMWRPALSWYPNVRTVLNDSIPTVFFPLDSRWLAAPTGLDDYALYRSPSPRWLAPYIAACYTVAADAAPGLTLREFFDAAIATGVEVKFGIGDDSFTLKYTLNMLGLVLHLTQSK